MPQKCIFIKDGLLTFSALGLLCTLTLIAFIVPSKSTFNVTAVPETQTAAVYTQTIREEKPEVQVQKPTQKETKPEEPTPTTTTPNETKTLEEVTTDKIVVLQTPPPPLPKAPVASFNEDEVFVEALIASIVAQTNAFRKDNNLHAFAYEETLEKNAQKYSTSMLAGDFFSHTNPSGCDLTCRFAQNGYEAQAWGENLAMYSFSEQPTTAEVASYFMKEWQKSAGHRDNLLSKDFTHQGVGVSVDNNSVYVTVQFAKAK